MAAEEAAPSPTAAASPENQAKWIAKSDNNMTQARSLISQMLTVLRNNDVAEAASKGASMEADKRAKEEKKEKVMKQASIHERIIESSFQCMQDIEDTILQTEDSMTKLTHERYKGFAFLQVCERRQELREKRPIQESFKDVLTDALASEKSVLEGARKDLLALEDEGKKVVNDLRDKRAFLSRDIGERRLQMMEDLKTLAPDLTIPPPTKKKKEAGSPKAGNDVEAPTNDAEAAPTSPAAAPATPAAAPEAAAEPAKEHKTPPTPEQLKAAEAESKKLIGETMKLLEKCSSHRLRTIELCIKVKQDAARANHRTEDCLARRTAELGSVKKQLESHALDVEAAIQRAERSLDRTEKRLDSKDPKKVEKLQADKAMLQNLRNVRSKLADDIQGKFAALEIDNMCRRVTAAKASEAKLKAATLTRSNSAPTLKKKGTANNDAASSMGETGMTALTEGAETDASTRPPSTKPQNSPGGSKSLKAAGAGLAQ
eukprot:CAMPEP_0197653992 /NCGR_PEP_ID=MMETSP1338-20131121/38143_1 /TAXON_ID=43686 ORGANISM="Pelagodinium beii, Strain RCC1491" /NCGR_SAMPLE_ID=MMETSP1338 /ASSEMBLY_ACC=CAM_ASM_000754 /LENGTH=487 /DNA_ID=CAMNT_0043229335 /DNA_START=43 /DNA_END=1506 /DNA_ORIENTATION=+